MGARAICTPAVSLGLWGEVAKMVVVVQWVWWGVTSVKGEGRRSWIRASAQVQCGSDPHERRRAGVGKGRPDHRAADSPTQSVRSRAGPAHQGVPTGQDGQSQAPQPAWPWAAVPRRVRTGRPAIVFPKGKPSCSLQAS